MRHSKSNINLPSKNQGIKSLKYGDLLLFNGNSIKSPPHQNKYYIINLIEKEKENKKRKNILNNEIKKYNASQNLNNNIDNENAMYQASSSCRSSMIPLPKSKNKNSIHKKKEGSSKNAHGNINNNQINIRLSLNNEIINNNYHSISKDKISSEELLKEKDLKIAKLEKELANKQRIINNLKKRNYSNSSNSNQNINQDALQTNNIDCGKKITKTYLNNQNNSHNPKTINSYKSHKNFPLCNNFIYNNSKSNTNLSNINSNNIFLNNSNFTKTPTNNMANETQIKSTYYSQAKQNNKNYNNSYYKNNCSNKNIIYSSTNSLYSCRQKNINSLINFNSIFTPKSSNNIFDNNFNNNTNINNEVNTIYYNYNNNTNNNQNNNSKSKRVFSSKRNSNFLLSNLNCIKNESNENSSLYCKSGHSSPRNSIKSINNKTNTSKSYKNKKLFNKLSNDCPDFDIINLNNMKLMEDGLFIKMKSEGHKKNINLINTSNSKINKPSNNLTNYSSKFNKSKKINPAKNNNYNKISSVEKLNSLCQDIKNRTKLILDKYLLVMQNPQNVNVNHLSNSKNNIESSKYLDNENVQF